MSVSPRATRTMLPLCCSATRAVCLLPQSITLCRFVPLVWETSSQQLKCQLLVTEFHLSFEIKNSVVQKVKHCNDVTVLQPCTLPRPLDKLRLQSHGPRDELVTPGNLQSLRKNVYSLPQVGDDLLLPLRETACKEGFVCTKSSLQLLQLLSDCHGCRFTTLAS